MKRVAEEQGDSLERLRHSAAHVMAEAVGQLFSGARFGIGPTIQDGFYYDFDLPRALTPEDLPQIEGRMREIIAGNRPFVREELDAEAARRLFADQPYKLELINVLEQEGGTISTYTQDGFTDLCRGPHAESTGQIRAFKLLSIAGAYWRGDERRPMLQRIYGTAFATGEELETHLARLAEAERRDHRRLGKELDLYSIHEESGPGLVHWHPKGATVRRLIEDFWKAEHIKREYDIVYTPHIARGDIWKTSGHWELYRDNLYSPMDVDGQPYLVKPMNCPFHILMYKSRLRSYRELPIRWAELGTVYRYERSGVLHGLTRVRGFTQDDAHIFCRPDQLEDEVADVVEFARFMLGTFGFAEYDMYVSTRPEKYAGTIEVWDEATETLKRSLGRLGLDYIIDPGEGVFYGPKIDIKLKDALGRAWQGPTIQVDFNLPQRFEVMFTGQDGQEHQVVMVHRTVLGSMERFFGCLIEQYGGAFPVWLAPVQAVVIPIADRHLEYAQNVRRQLRVEGLRAEVDDRSLRMNAKIREAQLQKVPYMLVVGDREAADGKVSVRLRSGEDLGGQPLGDFIARVNGLAGSRATDKLW
ncbi:MAG: threonine--tRNA ligase [Chloroflexi bacterium]|nr:threonine--tRNA ligase [Chloroflexota bacterium]